MSSQYDGDAAAARTFFLGVLTVAAALVLLAWFFQAPLVGEVPAVTFVVFSGFGIVARMLRPRAPRRGLPVALVPAGAMALLLPGTLVGWGAVAIGAAGLLRGDRYDRAVVSATTLVLGLSGAAWARDLTDRLVTDQLMIGGAVVGGDPPLTVGVTSALVVAVVLAVARSVFRWVAAWVDRRVSEPLPWPVTPWPQDLALAALAVAAAALWVVHPALLVLVAVPVAVATRVSSPADTAAAGVADTDLASSTMLRIALAEELARSAEFGRNVAVVLVDVDGLENVRREHGSEAGDVAVRSITRRVRRAAREYDIVARLDAGIFALALPDTGVEGAKVVADRVRRLVGTRPVILLDVPVQVTASLGVAVFPDDATDRGSLLTEAEMAAAYARLQGGDRTVFAADLPDGFRDDAGSRPRGTADLRAQDAPPALTPGLAGELRDLAPDVLPTTDPVGGDRMVRATPEILADARTGTDRVLVGVLAAAVLLSAFAVVTRPGPLDPGDLLLYGGLAVLAERFAVSIVGHATVSWAAVPLIALAILPGTAAVTVVAAALAAGVVGGMARGVHLRQAMFNAGTLIVASVAAYEVAVLVQPLDMSTVVSAAVVGILASLAFFAFDTVLVLAAVAVGERGSVLALWREDVSWLLPHQLGLGLLAAVMAFADAQIGALGVLLAAIPAVGLQLAQRLFMLRTRDQVSELRRANDDLRDANRRIGRVGDRLTGALDAVNRGYLATLETVATAVEARDDPAGNRLERVDAYARRLLSVLDPELLEDDVLLWGFRLHDIGHVTIPDRILLHPGPLDADAWEVVRRHPQAGADMVGGAPMLHRAVEVIRHHHERWDGTGYPDGLAGERIPFGARAFAVIDAFDAMTTDRPYRDRLRVDRALQELVRHAGSQFDPRIVDAFLTLDHEELAQIAATGTTPAGHP